MNFHSMLIPKTDSKVYMPEIETEIEFWSSALSKIEKLSNQLLVIGSQYHMHVVVKNCIPTTH